jgi:hypothetical protein
MQLLGAGVVEVRLPQRGGEQDLPGLAVVHDVAGENLQRKDLLSKHKIDSIR